MKFLVQKIEECFTLRFVILNFSGIYSFKCKDNFSLYKKFGYPQCIDRELEALDSSEISDCINLISSCIYTKYFLVENYKENVQLLEELQSVKLYFMENGLEATSKKFDSIEKIHLLEFIEEDKKLVVVGSI
ncbi:unnamed protein product [Rhizophagus irregularis]|nr:unnamed protein product [Rhizophagus irregularis]